MKSKWIAMTAFAAALSLAGLGMAQAPATTSTAPSKTAAKTKAVKATAAPTEQEIADAKSKGMVWVNTTTKVYHKDGALYGKTKRGKFMTEDDAKKAGFKEAKVSTAKKAKTAPKA